MNASDKRDGIRVLVIGFLTLLKAFSGRLGIDPLTGLESDSIIAFVTVALIVFRKGSTPPPDPIGP